MRGDMGGETSLLLVVSIRPSRYSTGGVRMKFALRLRRVRHPLRAMVVFYRRTSTGTYGGQRINFGMVLGGETPLDHRGIVV